MVATRSQTRALAEPTQDTQTQVTGLAVFSTEMQTADLAAIAPISRRRPSKKKLAGYGQNDSGGVTTQDSPEERETAVAASNNKGKAKAKAEVNAMAKVNAKAKVNAQAKVNARAKGNGKAKSEAAAKTATTSIAALPSQTSFDDGERPTSIMDIASELRNVIWGLVVVDDVAITVAPSRPFLKEPALLAVSRQVRSETMSIWYAEHDFEIVGSSPAVKFLRSRDDQQLRSIRSLRVLTEKSQLIVQAHATWFKHLKLKVNSLMREFGGRGLRRKAIRFQIMSSRGELTWVDGREIEQL